ncbi:hypothetical protein LTR08_007624 [Meristemomyces frigidus]|nr:hypothetical protein LTR08_007624 [Meristemomyces frigidus]
MSQSNAVIDLPYSVPKRGYPEPQRLSHEARARSPSRNNVPLRSPGSSPKSKRQVPARITIRQNPLAMPPTPATAARFKLVFFAPPSALAACKAAIFAAGAGRYPGPGVYTECCWSSTTGTGQFRPGNSANPHVGKVGEVEEVQEVRVETLCVGEEVARKAVGALKG